MYNFFPTIEVKKSTFYFVNILVPIIAVFLTLITGAIIFYIMGFDPVFALYTFFISPISNSYGISELLLKASPLALIAIGP